MYYEETTPNHVVSVLGSDYYIYRNVPRSIDSYLEDGDGYCDKTIKRIVTVGRSDGDDLSDWTVYEKSLLRHELIHAFLYESGLDGSTNWDNNGCDHPEQMVEWLAIQAPKIFKVFQQVDAL